MTERRTEKDGQTHGETDARTDGRRQTDGQRETDGRAVTEGRKEKDRTVRSDSFRLIPIQRNHNAEVKPAELQLHSSQVLKFRRAERIARTAERGGRPEPESRSVI